MTTLIKLYFMTCPASKCLKQVLWHAGFSSNDLKNRHITIGIPDTKRLFICLFLVQCLSNGSNSDPSVCDLNAPTIKLLEEQL